MINTVMDRMNQAIFRTNPVKFKTYLVISRINIVNCKENLVIFRKTPGCVRTRAETAQTMAYSKNLKL